MLHVIHVSTDGNDTTGDGTPTVPYLTVKHALSTITDSSSTNRYDILIDRDVTPKTIHCR